MSDAASTTRFDDRKIDPLTVCAVTIVVYFFCCFLHEAVGHAGVATLLGVDVTKVTTAYCRQQGASEGQARLIAAAGIPVNVLFGCLAIGLRSKRGQSMNGVTHYFLWLFAHMNLFTAGGYLMTFSMMKVADVNIAVRGLPYELAIRISLLLAGIGISVWTFFHAGRTLVEFAGHGEDRMRRAIKLTLTPYLVGGLTNVLASLLGAGTMSLGILLVSAVGSTFGGNFPLLWAPALMPKKSASPDNLTPSRSTPWLIAGAVFLAFYFVLGRGVSFA